MINEKSLDKNIEHTHLSCDCDGVVEFVVAAGV